jgi:hypothetical protein
MAGAAAGEAFRETGERFFPVNGQSRLLFIVVFLLSALYMARELKRGWVPHDEGTFAQSAERVLLGELPHRDFDEGYTGGETYLNAVALRILGTNLASLRYVLYLFFLAWVPATYYVASRFVSSSVASAVTLLAVVWGPPNYAAAMPSWYNLFFATFGVAALFRYITSEARRWLFLAGFCAGVSFLFKLTGLYFVAGVLLFLVLQEQLAPSSKSDRRERVTFYRIFLVASVVLYEALVFDLLRHAYTAKTFFAFWLPGLAVGIAIVWNEFIYGRARSGRFSFLFGRITVFAIGFTLPVIVFLTPNLLTGSALQVAKDVFFVSAAQVSHVRGNPWEVRAIYGITANLLFIAVAFCAPPRFRNAVGIGVIVSVPFVLYVIRVKQRLYMAGWSAVWLLVPIVLTLGVILVTREATLHRMTAVRLQRAFLLLSVTAVCTLIQFPVAIPIYLCYVAPLVILSATALISQLQSPPRFALLGVFVFLLLYMVLDVTPGFVYTMGLQYAPDTQTSTLTLPRAGGLRVYPESAQTYEDLGTVLRQHAQGEYIYAAPDCPEVYFLYGFRNPTRVFFDFHENIAQRTDGILATVRQHNVRLVVLNREPQFSGPIPVNLKATLDREFPNRAETGKFEVRWKP